MCLSDIKRHSDNISNRLLYRYPDQSSSERSLSSSVVVFQVFIHCGYVVTNRDLLILVSDSELCTNSSVRTMFGFLLNRLEIDVASERLQTVARILNIIEEVGAKFNQITLFSDSPPNNLRYTAIAQSIDFLFFNSSIVCSMKTLVPAICSIADRTVA